MTDLQKALQSKEMMDAYLELNKTEDIIKEIRDYAKTESINAEHYNITGNEPALPFEAATENELLSGHITGLTIRQEFAARAMQGILACGLYGIEGNAEYLSNVEGEINGRCDEAVLWADRLIISLNK